MSRGCSNSITLHLTHTTMSLRQLRLILMFLSGGGEGMFLTLISVDFISGHEQYDNVTCEEGKTQTETTLKRSRNEGSSEIGGGDTRVKNVFHMLQGHSKRQA